MLDNPLFDIFSCSILLIVILFLCFCTLRKTRFLFISKLFVVIVLLCQVALYLDYILRHT